SSAANSRSNERIRCQSASHSMITSASASGGRRRHARIPSKCAPVRALKAIVLSVSRAARAGRLTIVVENAENSAETAAPASATPTSTLSIAKARATLIAERSYHCLEGGHRRRAAPLAADIGG